jgi:hypothetical protein
MMQETWYLALHRLKILNAPGTVPSSVTVEVGQRVALDGTEPIDVDRLLRQGALRLYGGTPDEDAFIQSMVEQRAAERAKAATRPSRQRHGSINGKPA